MINQPEKKIDSAAPAQRLNRLRDQAARAQGRDPLKARAAPSASSACPILARVADQDNEVEFMKTFFRNIAALNRRAMQ